MSQFMGALFSNHPKLLTPEFKQLAQTLPSDLVLIGPRTKLTADVNRSKCVSVCDFLSPNAVIGSAFYNEIYHVVQIESLRFEQELRIAAAMIDQPAQFLKDPVKHVFGDAQDVKVKTFEFSSSREKERVLDELQAVLGEHSIPQVAQDAIFQIADELFTNAVFNAPADGLKQRYFNHDRTQAVELKDGEIVEIILAFNANWLWIGCRDPFGSYYHEKVLCKIYDSFQRGMGAAMNMGEGGAGIGCRMMFDLCSGFTVMVEPGRQTLVGYTLPLTHSIRLRETQSKHLHIGSTSGGKMGQLRVNEARKGSQLTLEFFGHIDEDADFNKMKLDGAQEVNLDLSGVTAINSCGIREWIKWIRGVPSGAKLTYTKCQKAIVDQINMIDGFLPKGAVVQSFYVPYFCESCETVTSVLLSQGKEYGTGGKVQVASEVKCSNCGKEAGLDVLENQYFRFVQTG